VDSSELVIRGGCHEESAFIPVGLTGPYPLPCGTLRGIDLIAWYTTAWMDKYVKGAGASADTRLLSDRWRNDAGSAQAELVQPGDPNVFSFYYRSRIDVGLAGGGRAVCDDVRAGCAALGPDGLPPDYSYVGDAWDTGAAAATPGQTSSGVTRQQLKRKAKKCKRKKGKARKRCIRKQAKKLARI
jgi:hypothetical protein